MFLLKMHEPTYPGRRHFSRSVGVYPHRADTTLTPPQRAHMADTPTLYALADRGFAEGLLPPLLACLLACLSRSKSKTSLARSQ